MELAPCTACRRHVSTTEAACPFCGGALETARRPRTLGRVSRAVVFAGAALATTACGKKAKQPDTKTTNQQVTPPVDAAAPEEPDTGEDRHRRHRDPSNLPMPYGAPPARQRYV